MITLTETDLLTDISRDELDGLAREALDQGQAAPIDLAITEALGVIRMYVDPWKVQDDALRRIWRLLSISSLYNRLSSLPDKRKDERNWALGVLAQIRDGKFPNLIVNPDLPAAETLTSVCGGERRRGVSLGVTQAPGSIPPDRSTSDP